MESTPLVVAELAQAAEVAESARAKWRRVIQEQKASGLPIARFCKQRGIGETSFFYWRRKFNGDATKPAKAKVESAPFVELTAPVDADTAIELHLRDEPGRRGSMPGQPRGLMPVLILRPGFDAALLRQVLAALGQRREVRS